MPVPQKILIVSSSVDARHTEPVAKLLKKRGYKVIMYEADKVIKGTVPFKIEITKQGLHISYDGESLNVEDIAAAWFRKPKTGIELSDKGKQATLLEECHLLQEIIWDAIPENRWLNAPKHIHDANKKMHQLLLARKLGFTIPQTIISNRWANIRESLPNSSVVLKMAYSILYAKDQTKVLYTTVFPDTANSLPTKSNPFPGIWQSYLQKKREWRITVVGDQVFPAAIYTTAKTNDDWRQYNPDDDVDFRKEDFPEDLGNKCLQMLHELKLQFGAFDFVESKDGTITFLEVNPNGQYAWLERLGLPVPQAIANKLSSIAEF